MSQFYDRLYYYISEYDNAVYDFYSKDSIAFLVNYYSIDRQNTVWDDNQMMSGPYERVGELSGVKFNKIVKLPVFQIDEISTSFDAQDIGYIKENTTSFVIPSSYNLTPVPGDFFTLEQAYMRPGNPENYPVFVVKGAEISANTDLRFWKLKAENEQSKTERDLDSQVFSVYSFYEYTKNIYLSSIQFFLQNLEHKTKQLKNDLNKMFDSNAGFYLLDSKLFPSDIYQPCNVYLYPSDTNLLTFLMNLENKNNHLVYHMNETYDDNSNFYLI